jgi:type I restriction enzyme S subunit
MEIKQGYRQTEFGAIPDDWILIKLENIGRVIRGASPRPKGDKKYYGGNVPRLMVEDVTRDGKFVTPKVDFLTEEGAKRSRPCKQGTLTVVCSGTVGIPSFLAVDACIHDGFLALVDIDKHVYKDYLFYQLTILRSKFENSATHGGIFTNLTTEIFRNFEIPLPPNIEEQYAIAAALSDVDALLATLDALIAKKRTIKQGVMQELLTGKTRLPGFSGEWEVKSLGDIVEITMGQSPSSANYNSKGIGLPLIQGNADVENRRTIVRVFTSEVTKKCFRGDIIMSVRAPVGLICKTEFDACLGRGVCAMRYPNDYLYHYLIRQETNWVKISKGSTFDSINSTNVKAFRVNLPEEEEQRAIADILSDMDAEINALEQQREKTRLLKQGMMQELLTGKTRLL